MARYVILDPAGKSNGVVVWNHDTEWQPPEGCTIVPEESPEGQAALAVLAAEQEAEAQALVQAQQPS